MLTLATHDTKRGADARARLAALSELPGEWREQLPVWSRILRGPATTGTEAPRPDRNDEYLLYQMLLGSWPCDLLDIQPAEAELTETATGAALRAYAQRIRGAMTKSMREARVHTNWAIPTAEYEEAMVAADRRRARRQSRQRLSRRLPAVARRLATLGAHHSLVQTALALTCPGVPDLYNGTELWDFALVDPDNRASIDYALRARLLDECLAQLRQDRATSMGRWLGAWQDGRIKLALTLTLLQYRRAQPELFAAGDISRSPSRAAKRTRSAPSRAPTPVRA